MGESSLDTPTGGREASLRAKHAALEAEIKAERDRPAPDSLRLQKLRKQKLAVKEELGQLTEIAVAIEAEVTPQVSAEVLTLPQRTVVTVGDFDSVESDQVSIPRAVTG